MLTRSLLLLPLLAACTPAPSDLSNLSTQDASANQTVNQSPDADKRRAEAPMGAVAGPCGSEKAAALLGQRYTPDLAKRLRTVTGAVSIRVLNPDSTADTSPFNPRRINVLLNHSEEIILLDCG